MERHFTATVFLFHTGKVLLHRHPKLKKWLPPGGHVEKNETPAEAARREAMEETNLEIEFVHQENLWIVSPTSKSFERPFLCLLEEIPAYKETPAHQHIDFVYLAKPIENCNLERIPREFQWFGFEELSSIEEELFEDTREILAHLFTSGDGASLLFASSQHPPFFYPAHRTR